MAGLDKEELSHGHLREGLGRPTIRWVRKLREHAAEAVGRRCRVMDAPHLQPLRRQVEEDNRAGLPEVEQHKRAGARDCHRGEHVEPTLAQSNQSAAEQGGQAEQHVGECNVREHVVPPLGALGPRPDAIREAEKHQAEQGNERRRTA